eukprot:scaffold25995_cov70-Phaeocystis_antarctica.AAC.5
MHRLIPKGQLVCTDVGVGLIARTRDIPSAPILVLVARDHRRATPKTSNLLESCMLARDDLDCRHRPPEGPV